jgi:sigma54-dependent transcription regulator
MDELRRFIAAGELRKAAVLLEAQLADAGRRLTKIEAEDARRRSFWDGQGADRGQIAPGAGGDSMKLNKLQRAGALCKETRQSDNLTDAAGRALQSIRQAIVESPNDAGLREMLSSFLRALSAYDSRVDTNAAEAARRFGEAIDNIIRERQFGRAVQSSLQKGMAPFDFWHR